MTLGILVRVNTPAKLDWVDCYAEIEGSKFIGWQLLPLKCVEFMVSYKISVLDLDQ
jgi:hypothetical protein